MNIRLSGKQLIFYGLVILLMGFAVGSVSLTYPFGRDQGIYAYAGKLLLEGKMNYQHVFDLKPPGIHFLFAFAQLFMGESMFNMRVFDIIWQSATAFIVFLIVFRLTSGKFLALTSAFLTVFLYYRQDYWHTLQADGMLNLPLAASVLLLISSAGSHSFIKIFFAGVLFASAMIFKYTIILFLPLALLLMFLNKQEPSGIRLKNVSVFLIGIIITAAAVIQLYYITGALDALVNLQFVQTPLYTQIAYETESGEFIKQHVIRLFTYSVYAPLIFFSAAGFIILARAKKIAFGALLISAWIAASLFSLIIQWKFYYYHFLVIIPPLAAGAVMFASALKNSLNQKIIRFAPAVFAVILLAYTAFGFKPYIANYTTLKNYLSGEMTLKEAYIHNGTTTDSVFMISKTFNAVDAVEQYSKPGDFIYMWGFDPLVYYLSGRKCVSRFIYSFPLFWKGENRMFRNEFISDVKKENPKLIIVANDDPLYFISGHNMDSKQLLGNFPEFEVFIELNYNHKMRIDDYDFYELKNW